MRRHAHYFYFPAESAKIADWVAEGTEFELLEDFALGAQSFEPEGDFLQEPFFPFRFVSSKTFAKSPPKSRNREKWQESWRIVEKMNKVFALMSHFEALPRLTIGG